MRWFIPLQPGESGASMKLSTLGALVIVGAFVLSACGGGDDADTASPAGGGIGGALDAAECAQVVAAMSEAAAAVPQAMYGEAGDLSTSLAQLKTFAEGAPAEIRGDLLTVYDGYGGVMAAMQDAGYDPSSGQPPSADVVAAMQTASAKLQSPEFVAASGRVSAWFKSNCRS
jgi:hypothetical protein